MSNSTQTVQQHLAQQGVENNVADLSQPDPFCCPLFLSGNLYLSNLRIDTEVEKLSEEQVHRIFRSAGVSLVPRWKGAGWKDTSLRQPVLLLEMKLGIRTYPPKV